MGWPSPATAAGRVLWHSVTMGPYAVPADGRFGSVIVTCDSEQKIDQKKATGKNKATSTQQGTNPCDVKFVLEGSDRLWEETEIFLEFIDPNSAGKGGPFEFSHPDTSRRGVKYVMVKKIGPVAWTGLKFTVTVECIEWEEPKKVVAGGATKTATTATAWHNAPMKGAATTGSGGGYAKGADGKEDKSTGQKAPGGHKFNFESGDVGTGEQPAAGPTAKKDPYKAATSDVPDAEP
jgi:hypothetical protein